MICSSHGTSYRLWRLKVFADLFIPRNEALAVHGTVRRSFSSTRKIRSSRPAPFTNNLKSQNKESSPEQLTEIPNEDTKDFRPSDFLPRSPLFKLAQTRPAGSRTRKPPGTKADDARLRNNPWAIALASPIRFCAVTAMRLPKPFLLDMGLVRQVDESSRNTKLWWMPTDLLKDELKEAVAAKSSSAEENNTEASEAASVKKPAVVRLLSRALLFEHLPRAQYLPVSRKLGNGRVKPGNLIPPDWRMSLTKSGQGELQTVDWPKGLPQLISKYMSQKVVKALKEAYRYEVIKEDSTDQWRTLSLASELSVPELLEALRHIDMTDMGTGAVVILGDLADSESKDPFLSSFPDYLTLPQTQSTVPVFDLSTLLSASDRRTLKECIPRFSERALFFRPDGPKSVDAMLALWVLKGYIMHDTDFYPFEFKMGP